MAKAKTVSCLFIMLILVGCASTPQRTGYLTDYDKLTRGQYVDEFWVDKPLVAQKKYSKVYLSEISIDNITDQKGVTAEDGHEWLKKAVTNAIKTTGARFSLQEDSAEAQARLEIAITEMTPGSAGGRVFAGELGIGHAWVQVEGRLVDLQSNQSVALFSDRKRSSGATGLRDVAGDSGPSLVREILEQIGENIIKELNGI